MNTELAHNGGRRQLRPLTSSGPALRGTSATNLGLALLAVATGISAARLLGPAGEGELAAIQTWPLLLATVAMLGLDSALVYCISRQPEKGRQFASTAVAIGLISAVALGAVAWFALPVLLSAQKPQVISAARVFLFVGGIYAVIGIPHGALRGAREFKAWNLFRIAPGLAWLCILFASYLSGMHDAIPLSRWYLAGVLACGIPILVTVDRSLSGPVKPNMSIAPEMLRFGLPSALTSLPQTINLRFDQLMIIAFLPARSLGIYVVAVSWSGAVAPLLSAVASVLFPNVSAEHDLERQRRLLATALQRGTIVAAATSMPFMLLAPVVLPLVFGARFAPSVPSALVLVPAGAVLGWAGIAEEGLRGLGRPTTVLVAELIAAAVTLVTLPVLLHSLGIFGAAVASLLGYSTVAVVAVAALCRSTGQKSRSLVFPTSLAAKSLASSLLRRRYYAQARHRSIGRHRVRGALDE